MQEGFGEPISYSGGRVGGIGKARKSGRGGSTTSAVTRKLGPPTDKAWAEKWRRDLKLAGVRTLPSLSFTMINFALETVS